MVSRTQLVAVGVFSAMCITAMMVAVMVHKHSQERKQPRRKRIKPVLLNLVQRSDLNSRKLLGIPWAVADLCMQRLHGELQSRAGISVDEQVAAFLLWLKHYPRLSLLSALIGNPGEVTCHRIVNEVLEVFVPALSRSLDMPPLRELVGVFTWRRTIIGVIDGTPLTIRRPTQEQDRFYRGDKARHFISMLILCNPAGRILWAGVGYPGHNNDQANYNSSTLRPFVRTSGAEILSDGGFFGDELVRPVIKPDTPLARVYNTIIQDNRAIVEHVNADIKEYEILSGRFRGSKEQLAAAAMAVCELHNFHLAWKNDKFF